MVTTLIVEIILKPIEILSNYVIHWELRKSYKSIILQKLTHRKKEIRFVVTRGEEYGEGKWDEGSQKVQTSSYKVNSRDVMYNINIINIAVCYV